jgi:hypothetical protein
MRQINAPTTSPNMKPFFLGRMEGYFKGFMVEYTERNKNNEADDLA